MVIEIETSSFIRDRSSLDKAHELKEKANQAYKEHDYRQLSLTNLQAMARNEREDNSEDSVDYGPTKSVGKHDQEDLIKVDEEEQRTDMNEFQSRNSRLRIDSTSRGEEMKQEATALIIKCYNNLAACIVNGPQRQKDDYMRAVYYCDKVLEFEPHNEKAIFRKGCALQKAQKYDKAIEEFQKCQNNSQAAALTEECRMKTIEDRKLILPQIQCGSGFGVVSRLVVKKRRHSGHPYMRSHIEDFQEHGDARNGHAGTNGNIRQ